MTRFWIYHGFKICQGSGYTKVLNMTGFFKKTLHYICLTGFRIFLRFWIWQGSKYARVTLHKVLNKTLHYRYLIGFWIRLYFLNARVTESRRYSEYRSGSQNTKILNLSGILICYSFIGYIHSVPNKARVLHTFQLMKTRQKLSNHIVQGHPY